MDHLTKKVRKKIVEAARKKWDDPKYRKIATARLKKQVEDAWKDKAFKKRMCAVRKKQAADPAEKKRKKDAAKKMWADPKYRAKMLAARANSSAYQNRGKKISKIQKKQFASGVREVWNKGESKHTNKILAKMSKDLTGVCPTKGRRRWMYQNKGRCVVMRSSWEVAFAYWLDTHKLKWEFEPRFFPVGKSKNFKGQTYTPDFWVPKWKCWVEIKGLESKEFRHKLKRFQTRYPNERIKVFRSADLIGMGVLDVRGCTKQLWAKQGLKVKQLPTLHREAA